MARKPTAIDPADEAFLKEVDEAYREDQMKQFFQRYGRWILLAVGVGLALLGAFLWWQAEQKRSADEQSDRFALALNDLSAGNEKDALPLIAAMATSRNPSYQSLAALAEAGIAASKNDEKGAIGLLQGVQKNARAAQPLRDAATLKEITLRFDTLAPDEALQRLQPYLAAGNPWFPVAAELGAFAHLKAGRTKEAGALFHQLAADKTAPPTLRARAEQMGASIGTDMTDIALAGAGLGEVDEQDIGAAAGSGPAGAAPERGNGIPQ